MLSSLILLKTLDVMLLLIGQLVLISNNDV
jgi:hypothetical protein